MPSDIIETRQAPTTSQAHMLGGGGYCDACGTFSGMACAARIGPRDGYPWASSESNRDLAVARRDVPLVNDLVPFRHVDPLVERARGTDVLRDRQQCVAG